MLSGVFIVNFEHISYLYLALLLFALNKWVFAGMKTSFNVTKKPETDHLNPWKKRINYKISLDFFTSLKHQRWGIDVYSKQINWLGCVIQVACIKYVIRKKDGGLQSILSKAILMNVY